MSAPLMTLDQTTIAAIADAVAERMAGQPGSARMLSASQVAARFGVSRDWVYGHADDLGAVRLGTGPRPRLRFDAERVAEALVAREKRNPSTTPAKPETPPKRPRWGRNVELLPIRGSEQ